MARRLVMRVQNDSDIAIESEPLETSALVSVIIRGFTTVGSGNYILQVSNTLNGPWNNLKTGTLNSDMFLFEFKNKLPDGWVRAIVPAHTQFEVWVEQTDYELFHNIPIQHKTTIAFTDAILDLTKPGFVPKVG